jgi:hypothetical protein
MGQKEGEVVSNRLALCVEPDFLAKNADPTRTPETSFIIYFFAKANPSTHGVILTGDALNATSALGLLVTWCLVKSKRPAGWRAFSMIWSSRF